MWTEAQRVENGYGYEGSERTGGKTKDVEFRSTTCSNISSYLDHGGHRRTRNQRLQNEAYYNLPGPQKIIQTHPQEHSFPSHLPPQYLYTSLFILLINAIM